MHKYIYIYTYIVEAHNSGVASTDLNSVCSICRCTICAISARFKQAEAGLVLCNLVPSFP
jgi:hypothetical protein